MVRRLRVVFFQIIFFLALIGAANAQPYNYQFTSGPIPMCDTSTFTANVSGVGILYPPGSPWWFFTLQLLTINITTDHPQTLQILLTSPQGTTLVLSQYNGAGGQNYTNTSFYYWGFPSITTGTAPFTGNWLAQGGSFSIFDGELGDGTWTITVIDTSCQTPPPIGPGGGPWTPGYFNGGGNGGFTIDFSSPPPPPCLGWIPSSFDYICPGQTFDLLGFYLAFNPGMVYTITFGGNPVANPSAVSTLGQYWIEAYDPWDGCQYYGTFDILQYPGTNMGPDQTLDVCLSNTPVDLTALFPITGLQTWAYNGSAITVLDAQNAYVSGVYQVIGTDAVGLCPDTAEVTLTILPDPALGPDQFVLICSNMEADLTMLYSTAGLTWAWYFGGNPISPPGAVSTAGTYSLIVTNAAGCTDTADIVLDVLPALLLGPDQNISECLIGTYDLTTLYNTSSFMTTYWYLSGSVVPNPAAISQSGIYTLIATDFNGCIDTVDVTLNLIPFPSLGANQSVTVCSNTTADLTTVVSVGANTPSWSYSGSPISLATAAAASITGTYTLIATNAAGCSDTVDITLSHYATPALGPDQNISGCVTGTYDLTPLYSTAGLTASWTLNGSPVANPAAVSANGAYMLVASSINGCSDTAIVNLSIAPQPNLGPDQIASTCSGIPADLTTLFSVGANTPSWFLGATPIAGSAAAAATTAGTYTLIITSAAGCSDTAEVVLTVNPTPALGADESHDICSNAVIDLTALYSIGANTPAWYFGVTPISVPAASAASNAGVYTLIATSAAGCSDTAEVTLNVNPAPALGANASTAICDGQTADLTVLFVIGANTPSWSFGGSAITTAAAAAASAAGSYTLVLTNAAGCADTALAQLTVNNNPVLGPDITVNGCDNVTMDLTTLYSTGANTVSWTTSGNPVATPNAVSTGGIYTIVITNASGCTATAAATLNFNPAPQLGADQQVSTCGGSPVDLTTLYTIGSNTPSWYFAGAPITLAAASAAVSGGTYMLVATSAAGCSDTAEVTFTANTNPSLGVDLSFALCPWQTVDLSTVFPVGSMTAAYSFNGSSVANYTAVYDSGTYAVYVTDLNGCTDEALAFVTNVFCLCTADFTYNGRCMQDPIHFDLLADSALVSAHWNFGGASMDQFVADPNVKFNTADPVMVTLQALLSCGLVTVQKEVKMTDCADSCGLYLPTAFTPNGDGKNDIWTWYGECDPEEFSVDIYNRFGQRIYTSSNPHAASWDGKYLSTASPEGVYVYHVTYQLPYQKKEVKTGTLSVTR